MLLGMFLRLAVYYPAGQRVRERLGMNATPEAMRQSKSRMRKGTDDGAEGMSRGSSAEACLSLAIAGICEKGKGEHRSKREDMCRS